MSQARRAAIETVDVSVHDDATRRGRTTGVGPTLRGALAPAAVVGLLVATTALTFVPMGPEDTTSVADPLAAHDARTANRASREFTRSTLPTPYSAAASSPVASPTLSVVAVTPSAVAAPSPVASPSVVPSETPVAAPTPAPSPTAAAAAAPAAAKKTPTVDWSVLGKEAGTRWVTGSVNVRSGPGTDHDVVNAFAEGRKVTVTDSMHDGWQQVSWKNRAGWIKATFLTKKEPVATKAPKTSSSSSSESSSSSSSKSSSSSTTKSSSSSTKSSSPSTTKSSSSSTKSSSPSTTKSSSSSSEKSSGSGNSAGTCSKAGNAENGMQSRTVSVLRKVCARFSSITSYGGFRPGSSGYHGSGQAIDAMISGEAGWEVARWVRANASSLGVVEVIYEQKIWTTQRGGEGWRSMSSRGGATANHFDHVHISVG